MAKSGRGSSPRQEGKVPSKQVDLLIVDGPSLYHIAKHQGGELSWRGEPTGVIYVFLRKLLSMAIATRPKTIVFGWDSPHLKRKVIYPRYKGNRGGRYDGLSRAELMQERQAVEQMVRLKGELLERLGFINNFEVTGYEADDVLAGIAKENHKLSKVLATRDHDLWQCVDGTTVWYEPVTGAFLDNKTFENQWGLPAYMWANVLQITGCSGDNVDGVVGVGDKTAVKYLRGELKPGSKKYQAIVGAKAMVEFNEALVALPYPGFMVPVVDLGARPYKSEFIGMCEKFGFISLLDDLSRYIEYFRLV
jgi:DNA polymerase I